MAQRARILVVDDSSVNQVLVESILGDEYDLAFADTGLEAVYVAQTFRPDLMLLDIVMPGIDGYETCRQLRSNPDLQHVKIILVSGRSEVTDRLEGYEAGADDYLTKPFETEELVAKIKVFLRLKSVEELDQLRMGILTLINHETRTPLNAIQGALQLLQMEDHPPQAEMDQILKDSFANCELLTHLIGRSILLSELKSGSVQFEFQPVDFENVVDAAVTSVEQEAGQRAISVQKEITAELSALADPKYLAMLLSSLLDNAIRFSAENGIVEVRVTPGHESVILEVEDHGQGIEASYLPYVFEACVPNDIGHHTSGQGLSLAIGREIIRGHRGEISFTSRPGEGTCFQVILPNCAISDEISCDEARHTCPV